MAQVLHSRIDQTFPTFRAPPPRTNLKLSALHAGPMPLHHSNMAVGQYRAESHATTTTSTIADNGVAQYVGHHGALGSRSNHTANALPALHQSLYTLERRAVAPSQLNSRCKSELNLRAPMATSKATNSMLTDEETYQIQLMYSGRATRVIVCSCLANLYFAPRKGKSAPKKNEWALAATGVPVLMQDQGESRTRQNKQTQIILAEKGTGFCLWKDSIDPRTYYTETGKSFHTLYLSDCDTRTAGLSFDSPYSAMQFYQHVKYLNMAAESLNNNNSPSKHARTRRNSFSGTLKKLLKKSDISTPCCFNHVTCLKPDDLTEEGAPPFEDGGQRPKRAASCLVIPGAMISPSRSV